MARRLADVPATDPDGDGNPGISAFPRRDEGYVPPPVSIGSATNDPFDGTQADEVGIASRFKLSIDGQRDGCLDAAGSATLHAFDGAPVYCHTESGGDCTTNQVSFVQDRAPAFEVDSDGTFAMTAVGSMSCAEARDALP